MTNKRESFWTPINPNRVCRNDNKTTIPEIPTSEDRLCRNDSFKRILKTFIEKLIDEG